MPMYKVCDEHEVAYGDPRGAQGHRNFLHKDNDGWQFTEMEEEAIPDNYEIKPTASKVKAAVRKHEKAESRETTSVEIPPDKPDAQRLLTLLQYINLTSREIDTILRTYIGFAAFQEDPNQLHALIANNLVESKRQAQMIPHVVREMFANQTNGSTPFYGTPAKGASSYYTVGMTGPNEPLYRYGNTTAYAGWYPPLTNSDTVTRLSEEVRNISQKHEEEMRATRDELVREREDRKRAEERRTLEARFEKLEQQNTALSEKLLTALSSNGNKGDSDLVNVLKGMMEQSQAQLKAIQERLEDDWKKSVTNAVVGLAKKIEDQSREPVGRSTEDLLLTLGPDALAMIREAGRNVTQEMKELREQALPHAAELTPPMVDNNPPLSDNEVIQLGEIENQIIGLDTNLNSQELDADLEDLDGYTLSGPDTPTEAAEPGSSTPDDLRSRLRIG